MLSMRRPLLLSRRLYSTSCYEQGSTPSSKRFARQYFYYVDHHGMLFMDDARIKNFVSAFKEKHFLDFFFRRVRPNDTGEWPDFPYISPCGRELNFLRCDDRPIVFLTLERDELTYGNSLRVPFQLNSLAFSISSGRLYHPAPVGGMGLMCSALAVELGRNIEVDEDGNRATLLYQNNKPIQLQVLS